MAKDKKIQSKPTVNTEAVKPAAEVKAASAEKPAPIEKIVEKKAEIKADKPAPAKKPAAKKAPLKTDVFLIQGAGEHTVSDITELCKADYKNGSRKHVKSIDVYVKAENGELRAYYVVNGNPEGKYIVL